MNSKEWIMEFESLNVWLL